MQMLHAVLMLRDAVLLPQASPMDQLRRAGRHDGRSRLCSAAALQIALAERRQLSDVTCSPRSLLLLRQGWRADFEAFAMSLSSFVCAWPLACGQTLSVCVGCVRETGYRHWLVRQGRVKVGSH